MNGQILVGAFLFIVYLSSGDCEDACPNIFPRNRWGGRPPREPSHIFPLKPPQYVIIHQTATPHCVSHAGCSMAVRNIQNAHFSQKGYNDIGYHFLIGGNGFIYEGRGWHTQAELSPNFNDRAISIALIGGFEAVLPDIRAMNSLRALISCGLYRHYLRPDFRFIAHRQVSSTTICPGKALLRYMISWPRFEFNPKVVFENNTSVLVQ